MWWIIPVAIALVIAGLAVLPVGLRVIYDKDGLTAKLLVWFFPYKLNITEINEKSFERRMKTKKMMEENPDYQPPIIHPDGTLREFFPLLDLYNLFSIAASSCRHPRRCHSAGLQRSVSLQNPLINDFFRSPEP